MVSKVVRQKRWWHTSDAVAIGVAFVAIVFEVLFPTSFQYQRVVLIAGLFVLVGSFMVLIVAKRAFTAYAQSTKPGEEITELITTGIFARYRNPIYLSVILNVYAVGLLVDSVWLSAASLAVWVILHYRFVLPEERYLANQFGDEFDAYVASSRRWI